MAGQDPREDPAQRRRNVRFAVVLGVIALVVYVAFFVIKGMGGS